MSHANNLGNLYEKITDTEIRKSIGQYYTPFYIVKYILEETLNNIDIVENPFISIIDISCGAGYFLQGAYDKLKLEFISKLHILRKKYKWEIYNIEINGAIKKISGIDYWVEDNLHYHLIKHCIYGADKDPLAVHLTKLNLGLKEPDKIINEFNIVQCDSLVKWEKDYDWKDLRSQLEYDNNKDEYLLKYKNYDEDWKEINIDKDRALEHIKLGEFWNKKYDISLGNPPYIGHKKLDSEYKDWLLNNYGDVFRDKSDISFCFFYRILDILKPKGISGIITSRYFMESPTGQQLRIFLKDKTSIKKIVDFYGARIFKDAEVATAIFIFSKKDKSNNIVVYKLLNDNYNFKDNEKLNKTLNSSVFEQFNIEQNKLVDERWLLISKDSMDIYKKIEMHTKYKLKDIAISFQGIITGCDKAFILSSEDIDYYNIEKDLLRPWIKNSNVSRYIIEPRDLCLIYSDLIHDEKKYPNSIKFISKHMDKLMNRRECKKGIRKWYELQWGRDRQLFEQKKIVFPYKARYNRFALDNNSYYSSADVYSIIIKEEFKDLFPLEYLVGLLNSSIYEFYFKLFAKKMGRGIYDYYPNSIMDLKIISCEKIIKEINILVTEILDILPTNNNHKLEELELEIDNLINDYFGIGKKEFEIIKNMP